MLYTRFSSEVALLNLILNSRLKARKMTTSATDEILAQLGVQGDLDATPFKLPKLPYAPSALEPYMGTETVSTHYGKHHAGYLRKLNGFLANNPVLQGKTLEEIIKISEGGIFNNAAQFYNHNIFWKCLTPNAKPTPPSPLKEAISTSFVSFDNFKEKFSQKAVEVFGSGWVWLVKERDGNLTIESAPNAVNPLKTGTGTPILGLDVWEHAYYLDYKNDRAKYIQAFFKIINWDFVNEMYKQN